MHVGDHVSPIKWGFREDVAASQEEFWDTHGFWLLGQLWSTAATSDCCFSVTLSLHFFGFIMIRSHSRVKSMNDFNNMLRFHSVRRPFEV